jgi:hypothetical protein
MQRGKVITIYRSGMINACSSIDALKVKYEILRAKNNDGDWAITIQRK